MKRASARVYPGGHQFAMQPQAATLSIRVPSTPSSRWSAATAWTARMAEIRRLRRVRAARRTGDPPAPRARTGDRAPARTAEPPAASTAERHAARLAAAAVALLAGELAPQGANAAARACCALALSGHGTLMPLFHLLRTAALQRARGFEVGFAGLEDGAPLRSAAVARDGVEAEVACDVVSAEDGRLVHRGAWFRLADRIDAGSAEPGCAGIPAATC